MREGRRTLLIWIVIQSIILSQSFMLQAEDMPGNASDTQSHPQVTKILDEIDPKTTTMHLPKVVMHLIKKGPPSSVTQTMSEGDNSAVFVKMQSAIQEDGPTRRAQALEFLFRRGHTVLMLGALASVPRVKLELEAYYNNDGLPKSSIGTASEVAKVLATSILRTTNSTEMWMQVANSGLFETVAERAIMMGVESTGNKIKDELIKKELLTNALTRHLIGLPSLGFYSFGGQWHKATLEILKARPEYRNNLIKLAGSDLELPESFFNILSSPSLLRDYMAAAFQALTTSQTLQDMLALSYREFVKLDTFETYGLLQAGGSIGKLAGESLGGAATRAFLGSVGRGAIWGEQIGGGAGALLGSIIFLLGKEIPPIKNATDKADNVVRGLEQKEAKIYEEESCKRVSGQGKVHCTLGTSTLGEGASEIDALKNEIAIARSISKDPSLDVEGNLACGHLEGARTYREAAISSALQRLSVLLTKILPSLVPHLKNKNDEEELLENLSWGSAKVTAKSHREALDKMLKLSDELYRQNILVNSIANASEDPWGSWWKIRPLLPEFEKFKLFQADLTKDRAFNMYASDFSAKLNENPILLTTVVSQDDRSGDLKSQPLIEILLKTDHQQVKDAISLSQVLHSISADPMPKDKDDLARYEIISKINYVSPKYWEKVAIARTTKEEAIMKAAGRRLGQLREEQARGRALLDFFNEKAKEPPAELKDQAHDARTKIAELESDLSDSPRFLSPCLTAIDDPAHLGCFSAKTRTRVKESIKYELAQANEVQAAFKDLFNWNGSPEEVLSKLNFILKTNNEVFTQSRFLEKYKLFKNLQKEKKAEESNAELKKLEAEKKNLELKRAQDLANAFVNEAKQSATPPRDQEALELEAQQAALKVFQFNQAHPLAKRIGEIEKQILELQKR